MKRIILLISFISICLNALCQDTFSDYKIAYEKLDITKVSGNILYMLNEQMKSIDSNQYKSFIQSKREDIYKRFDLGNKNNQQLFLDNYNQNLSKVKDKILSNDVLMHVSPKVIADYGSDVLTKYQGNYSSEYINKLLQPVIKAKLVEYTNSKINEVSKIVLSEQNRLNDLSEQIIAYWKTNGENINLIKQDVNVIQQKILIVINQIPAPDSLKNFLIHSADGLANNIKVKFDDGWNGMIATVISDKNQYKNQFTQLYQDYSIKVKSKTEESFKNLGLAIDSLARNEVKVYETLNKIQTDFNTAKAKLGNLEGLMKDAQNNANLLKDYTLQHAKLVAENFIRLDVINKYVNKGVEVYNTISLIKSNVFDKVTDPEFINSLSLDNLSLPTLSDACASAAGFASQVARTFPNCQPLQVVASAANYLMAAVNIGIGVAELYSMNPMGLINIFSGLSSVFGGKPEPSPEMKMMQQMMDYMQKQFENINNHLKYIEDQLSNLTQTVQEMYRDMMKSFQVLNAKLDQVLWENNTLYNATRDLIFRDMVPCESLERIRTSDWENDSRQFNTYEDVYEFYQGNDEDMKPCLPSLRAFSAPLLSNVLSFSMTLPAQKLTLKVDDLENAFAINQFIYTPMKKLFTTFYGNDCYAINSLALPSSNISTNGYNYAGVKSINKCLDSDTQKVFSTYYNYAAIKYISDLLITYNNFYILRDARSEPYFPLTLLEFLKLPAQSISDRFNGRINDMKNLLSTTNKAIMQQSLMAGNNVLNVAYNYLLGLYNSDRPDSKDIIENTIVALENNKLFAKNFASMLVNGSINQAIPNDKIRAKKFTDLYFSTDVSRKDSLNAEFKIPMVTYDLDNTSTLILRIDNKTRGREFTIPVPSPTFIINDEMAQSDGLYTLLATKQKIINKLIDLTYFQKFEPVKGLNKNDYKYLVQEINN